MFENRASINRRRHRGQALRGRIALLATVAVVGWSPSAGLAGGVHSHLFSARVNPANQQTVLANGSVGDPVLSEDRLAIIFSARAPSLTPGIPDSGFSQILSLDREAGSFRIDSRAAGELGAIGSGSSRTPSFAKGTRAVVFRSTATNLVPEESGDDWDVFYRDRVAHTTELVSKADPSMGGAPANKGIYQLSRSSVSADGCRIVFASQSTNLVPGWVGNPNPTWATTVHVFLRDRCSDQTLWLNRPVGNVACNSNSDNVVISADGRYAAFISTCNVLPMSDAVPGDRDVFVYDVDQGAMRARLDFDVMESTAEIDIDGIGMYVVGVSNAPKSPLDSNDQADVYRVHVPSGQFEIVSLYGDGTAGGSTGARNPTISRSGRFVAFTTERNLTGELQSPYRVQAWRRDMDQGETKLLSRHHLSGTGGTTNGVNAPRIDPVGDFVTFATHENLDPRDTGALFAQGYLGGASSLDIVDPNPDLLDEEGLSGDLGRLANGGREAIGLVADGVSRLLLRYHVADSSSVTATFTLRDELGGISDDAGLLASLDGTMASPSQIEVPVILLPTNERIALALLLAPADFERAEFPGDATSSMRFVEVEATESVGGVPIQVALQVRRPPVVLMHGLWSERGTWDYDLLGKPGFDFEAHDYRTTNAAPYEDNREQASIATFRALDRTRQAGIAAAQVDYVGHSMGGILGRQWAAGDHCTGYNCFRRLDNFYSGDFHKLITLGTPHRGSELANVLTAAFPPNPLPIIKLRQFLRAHDKCVDCGAVQDLRTDSPETTSLGQAVVPSHAIGGNGGSLHSEWHIRAIAKLLTGSSLEQIFGTEDHDEIVPLHSQLGGLEPESTTTIFPGPITPRAIHTTESNEEEFGERIEELLRLPASAPEFQQSGFPPAPVPLRSGPTSAPRVRVLSAAGDSFLTITNQGIEPFYPGDIVPILVTATGEFYPEAVTLFFGNQTLEMTEGPFLFEVEIPVNAIGTIPVGAMAGGDSGILAEFTIASAELPRGVPVTVDASLESVRVEPPGVHSNPTTFPALPLTVFGLFGDGVERDVAILGPTFTSSDSAVVSVTEAGKLRFLQRGFASIRVEVEGQEVTVPVAVRTNPIHLVVEDVLSDSALLYVGNLVAPETVRIYATTSFVPGSFEIPDCERVALDLDAPTLLATSDPVSEGESQLSITVPFPAGSPAMRIQVVTEECALSPVTALLRP